MIASWKCQSLLLDQNFIEIYKSERINNKKNYLKKEIPLFVCSCEYTSIRSVGLKFVVFRSQWNMDEFLKPKVHITYGCGIHVYITYIYVCNGNNKEKETMSLKMSRGRTWEREKGEKWYN